MGWPRYAQYMKAARGNARRLSTPAVRRCVAYPLFGGNDPVIHLPQIGADRTPALDAHPPNLGGCERGSAGAFFTSTVEDIGDLPWNTSISF